MNDPLADTTVINAEIPTEPCVITFYDPDGTEAGVLDWSDGTMRFEGDADESAKIFIEFIKDRYQKDPS